jgi:hypothetical protein
MSQILLPPSSQEPQPSDAAPEETTPTSPPVYTFQPLRRPSRFWRIVKWPLRQVLKGIYLAGSAINRHRIISLILLVVLGALVTGGVLTYRAFNPEPKQVASGNGGGVAAIPETPFTVVDGAHQPLSNGVLLWLHGAKTYNADELWNGMSTEYQNFFVSNGSSQISLQQTLDTWRFQGLKFDEFIVAGSFRFPDGTATYTVEVVAHEKDQQGIFTWYFRTDPSGQIISFRDITQ